MYDQANNSEILKMSKTVGGQFNDTSFTQRKQGGGSRIKVAVRIRPLLDSEQQQGHTSTCLTVSEGNQKIR